MGFEPISNVSSVNNNAGKSYNLFIDQNNDKELLVTNQIDIPGASFKDILEAKLINQNGQNIHTCQVNQDLPAHLKLPSNNVSALA